MRWFLVMLLALALALAWWLSSRQSEPVANQETAKKTAHETGSASRDSEDPRDDARMQPRPGIPTLPAGVGVRFDTSLHPPENDDPQSVMKAEWERDQRVAFTHLFTRFRREAELTDEQTRAVLLVLYDLQEEYQAGLRADDQVRTEAEGARMSLVLDQIYGQGVGILYERMRALLDADQLRIWRRYAIKEELLIKLIFDAPLTAEAGR